MKRTIVIVGISLGLVIVGILAYRTSLPLVSSSTTSDAKVPANSSIAQENPTENLPAKPPLVVEKASAPSLPAQPEGASHRPFIPHPEPPDAPAKVALNAVALNVRNYGFRFGGNPTGSNAEITKALNGDNPAHAKYLPAEHTNISAQGELLDYWGTPYFFHQQSATETVIRSAGPDKKLYTVDDITAK